MIRPIQPDLYSNGDCFRIAIYLAIIMFFIIAFFYSVFRLLRQNHTKGILSRTFRRIFGPAFQWYHETFLVLWAFVELWLPKKHCAAIWQTLGMFFYKRMDDVWFNRGIVVMFHILPRVIVLIAFVIDAFIANEFHYIYRYSGVLLVPLLAKFILFFIDYYWKMAIKEYAKVIIFVDTSGNIYTPMEHFLKSCTESFTTTIEFNPQFIEMQMKSEKSTATFQDNATILKEHAIGYIYVVQPIGFAFYAYKLTYQHILLYTTLLRLLIYAILWSLLLYKCW